MRAILFCLLLLPLPVMAQMSYAPGFFISRADSATIDGVLYTKGEKYGVQGGKDSVTIKEIVTRQMNGEYGNFVFSKRGYYYPVDEIAKYYCLNSGKIDGLKRDTLVTSTGYKIGVGQKIKIGMGTNPDGDFKFIRTNSASLFRYYSANGDRRAANSANAADAGYAGLEFAVIRIERRKVPNHGGADYLIINSSGTGLIKYEIDIERAIRVGEVEVPDEYKPKSMLGTTIVQPLSVADELLKFKKLLDAGAITQEEYDQQKKKLLGQ